MDNYGEHFVYTDVINWQCYESDSLDPILGVKHHMTCHSFSKNKNKIQFEWLTDDWICHPMNEYLIDVWLLTWSQHNHCWMTWELPAIWYQVVYILVYSTFLNLFGFTWFSLPPPTYSVPMVTKWDKVPLQTSCGSGMTMCGMCAGACLVCAIPVLTCR